MILRVQSTVKIVLFLAYSFLLIAGTYAALSRVQSSEVAELLTGNEALRARAAVRDSLDALDSLLIASLEADVVRLETERAEAEAEAEQLRDASVLTRTEQARTGLALQDVVTGHPGGERLLAEHLAADSADHVADEAEKANLRYQVTRLDSLLIHTTAVADLWRDRFLRADSTAKEALAQLTIAEDLIRRQDRRLNPPFAVKAGRLGFEAGTTYLIATEGFELEPLEGLALSVGVPLARCVVKRLPWIGDALAGECAFD